MVGLVDYHPMRPCGRNAQLRDKRQQLGKKAGSVREIDAEKVDHDILPGIPEKLDDFGRPWGSLDVSQDNCAFEIVVIAFRVDDAELEPTIRYLLDKADRGRRLAAARRAGDQHAAALRVKADRRFLPRRLRRRQTAAQFAARSRRGRCRAARSIVSATPAPRAALVTISAAALTSGQRVGDRDGAAAGPQEGMIVLGVADADDIVRRQAQVARARRPGRSPC